MNITSLPEINREIFAGGLITRVEFRKFQFKISSLQETTEFQIDLNYKREQVISRRLKTLSKQIEISEELIKKIKRSTGSLKARYLLESLEMIIEDTSKELIRYSQSLEIKTLNKLTGG